MPGSLHLLSARNHPLLRVDAGEAACVSRARHPHVGGGMGPVRGVLGSQEGGQELI
jgi:hypothetical protein